MKRKILSLILSTCMALSLFPINVFAAETDSFTVTCGETTTGYAEFDAAWDAAQAAASSEASRAVLTMNADYTITSRYTSPYEIEAGDYITLDLNGHTLARTLTSARSNGRHFNVLPDGNFTVDDTSETGEGKISGGYFKSLGDGGGAVYVKKGGTFTLNGGSICENISYEKGGAIYNMGTFVMNGGSIRDNEVKVTNGTADGGGVSNFGTFTMTAGEITGNTANGGGGVHNYGNTFSISGPGSFTMTGGKISGNTANGAGGAIQNSGILIVENSELSDNTALWGGGIYSWGDQVDAAVTIRGTTEIKNNRAFTTDGNGSGGGIYFEDGTLSIEDGSITGNSSVWGGGLYVQTTEGALINGNVAEFSMSGGTISGNTAEKYGGGADMWDSNFTMTGGEITLNEGVWGGGLHLGGGDLKLHGGQITNNNAATVWGGGVYYSYGTLSLQGDMVITGNAAEGTIENGVLTGGTPNNFFLGEDTTVAVGTLGSSAEIGLTAEVDPTAEAPLTLSSNTDVTEENVSKFSSDYEQFCIWMDNGTMKLYVHVCDQEVQEDAYLKSAADYENNAVYYKSCVCGGKGTETFEAAGTKLVDTTASTGEITINGESFTEFVDADAITFEDFSKESVELAITAEDNETGVKSIQYYISETPVSEADIAAVTEWTDFTTLSLENEGKYIVYLKITDNSDNVTYISSNGLVIDKTQPTVSGIINGATYCSAVEVTVSDTYLEGVTVNGTAVTVENGKVTVSPQDGAQNIVVSDKAGNSVEYTITVSDHDWNDTVYEWSTDGKTCTATRTCKTDSTHTETAEAVVTGKETKAPTCTEKGETTYTATFEAAWAAQQTKTLADLSAVGHDWNDTVYAWSTDGKTCTATRTCKTDSTHTETVEAVVTDKETKAPTCTEKGETTYTAAFKAEWAVKQTTTLADVPADGHSYVFHEEVPATHEADGTKAYYTCENCDIIFDEEKNVATEDELVIETIAHSYGSSWKSDAKNHWHECSCGEKADTNVHSFTWVLDKVPTDSEAGSRHEQCTVCGFKRAAVEIPAAGKNEPDDSNDSAPSTTPAQPSVPGSGISPATGDSMNPALWSVLLLIACGSLIGMCYDRRKKQIK